MRITIKNLSKIFIFHILFIAIWVIIIDVVLNLRDYDSSVENGFYESPLWYVFFAVLVAPIWEEIVFRLPLRRNKYIWSTMILGLFFLLGFELLVLKIFTALYMLVVFLFWLSQFNFLKHVIIWLSILLFGLIHIGNYSIVDIEQMNLLEFVSLFFSQLILGGVLTFIRLRYSFKYSVIYHSMFNGILLSLGAILMRCEEQTNAIVGFINHI